MRETEILLDFPQSQKFHTVPWYLVDLPSNVQTSHSALCSRVCWVVCCPEFYPRPWFSLPPSCQITFILRRLVAKEILYKNKKHSAGRLDKTKGLCSLLQLWIILPPTQNQFVVSMSKLISETKWLLLDLPENENLEIWDVWFETMKHFLKHSLKTCIFTFQP